MVEFSALFYKKVVGSVWAKLHSSQLIDGLIDWLIDNFIRFLHKVLIAGLWFCLMFILLNLFKNLVILAWELSNVSDVCKLPWDFVDLWYSYIFTTLTCEVSIHSEMKIYLWLTNLVWISHEVYSDLVSEFFLTIFQYVRICACMYICVYWVGQKDCSFSIHGVSIA